MNLSINENEVYDILLAKCLEMYISKESLNVFDMATKLMDYEGIPMHHPFHHFIVPAVLLTACFKAQKKPYSELLESLDEAMVRSRNILGGFCGNYGNCGAAVGTGIFMSIITDTSPLSEMTWAWANETTGICLVEISKIPGPRCCKRTVFIALKNALQIIKNKLQIELPFKNEIICRYHKHNAQCKKELCPFYKSELAEGIPS